MTGAEPNPREQLVAVVLDLAARLPAEQAPLLSLARFEPERAALARLRDPEWAALAARACSPPEALRLLTLAQSRDRALRAPAPAVPGGLPDGC